MPIQRHRQAVPGQQIDQLTKLVTALTDKNQALETALTEATEKKRGKAA